MRLRFLGPMLIAFAAVGCGKDNSPAEVPKNPVPMQKPGQTARPEIGRGLADPGQKSKKLP